MSVDPIRAADDSLTRVVGVQTHALFEEHARMVYGLCRALLRDPDDADDATQATFISAYRSLLGGSDVREPAAWLATIARNECSARARARMREPLPLLETDLGHAPGPESELDRKAVVDELQQAIAGLPEKQREAVVLRDLYGLQYTEVGAALGMSVSSVESLLFRARRSLRVSLKPLAGGALTVPVAVREGIAQALPTFSTARTAGGGAASGAIGLGLLAKLTGGSAGVKTAAGLAAAIAAGSVAVMGVEREGKQRPSPAERGTQPRVVAANDSRAIRDPKVASPVAAPIVAVTAVGRPGKEESSGRGDDRPDAGTEGVRADRDGTEGSDDTKPADGGRSGHEGSAGTRSGGGEDAGASGRSGQPGHSGDDGGQSGSAGSAHDDGDEDDSDSHEDVLSAEKSHSDGSHEGREGRGDSGSGGEADEVEDPEHPEDPEEAEDSEGSGEDRPASDESGHGGSEHGSDDESDDGTDEPPA